jgi:glycosyltransferase involved in cell wall biosynthesis
MPDRRLVFVHAYAPPTPGGTPIIVHRLLARLDGVGIDTVTQIGLRGRVRRGEFRLPGPYHYVVKLPAWGQRRALGLAALAAGNTLLGAVAGVRAAITARRARADWIVSVVDEGFSVIAGDICARLSGVPHVIWVFDLWEENAYSTADRRVAALLERGLWRRAAAVLGHDEEIAEHYARKHGVRGRVIPTPIEPGGGEPVAARSPEAPYEVLFGGSLYWAQEDALRRLARVCSAMDDVRLTVIGDEAVARAKGIEADAFEPRLSSDEFRSRVERADVAFVGLSFGSDHPDVIATASPARLPECMASLTPMLVHAPAGSHVAEYARREGFAEVVDQPDDHALAAGLRRVLDDGSLSTMRARRAWSLALERHEASHVRDELRAILEAVRR